MKETLLIPNKLNYKPTPIMYISIIYNNILSMPYKLRHILSIYFALVYFYFYLGKKINREG